MNIITIAEIAKLRCLLRSTVAHWCNKGGLKNFRCGNFRFIYKDDLIDFLLESGQIDQDTAEFLRKCNAR